MLAQLEGKSSPVSDKEQADVHAWWNTVAETCHSEDLPLHSLLVAFHNLVSYTVDKKWLKKGKEFTCASEALRDKAPLNCEE